MTMLSFFTHLLQFPMRISVRASVNGNEWVAVSDEIVTSLSFIFFLNESCGWRVQGCCKSAQALLGMDLIAMKAGE